MKAAIKVQKPGAGEAATIWSLVKSHFETREYDVIRVAVAYATVSGVRLLLDIVNQRAIRKSYWLIGLDDIISQPGAIDLLMKMQNSEVRIASYEDLGLRFHPKVFSFEADDKKKSSFSIIGSANLTANALLENAEIAVSLVSQSSSDKSNLRRSWNELWSQGHVPSAEEIDEYRARYEEAQLQRKKSRRGTKQKERQTKRRRTRLILQSDRAEIDPSFASVCWIECGSNTAMGRELEFKAEQGLFFGLDPAGEEPKFFRFHVSDKTKVDLRMKYQGNHMWRLQLNRGVPEVNRGLRPKLKGGKLGRSPYVAVIERVTINDEYSLRFIRLSGTEFKNLESRTRKLGTFGQTSARKYGWC